MKNRKLITIIIAGISLVIIIVLNVIGFRSGVISFEPETKAEDIKTYFVENIYFTGSMDVNNVSSEIFLTIKNIAEINKRKEFTYSLKINKVPIILSKNATLKPDNSLFFDTKGIKKHRNMVEKLNESTLSYDEKNKKLQITDKNHTWILKQL